MVSATTVNGAPGTGRTALVRGDPLVPRMLLGKRLRELREARNMSRAEAGRRIGGSPSKIIRLERGTSGARLGDIAALLTAYGVHDEGERSGVLAIAEQTDARPWWHEYREVVPETRRRYLSAEEAAKLVRCFEDRYVPDLLQTEAYARALLPGGSAARHVELLNRRQRFLRRRPRPINLWAVLDEAVLWNPVGDATTMCDQLKHIAELAWRPNVTIQITPYNIRHRVAGTAPLTLLRFPQTGLPDLVHLSESYPSRRAEVERHWHFFNTLVTEANPPEHTPRIIERILAHRSRTPV